MSTKLEIIGSLGEKQLVLPDLVESGPAANGRVKYLFTLLQPAWDYQAFPVTQSPAGVGQVSHRNARQSSGLPTLQTG